MAEFGDSIKEYLTDILPSLGIKGKINVESTSKYTVQEPNQAYLIKANGHNFLCKADWMRSSDYPLAKELQKLRSLEQYGIAPKPHLLENDYFECQLLINELPSDEQLGKDQVPANLSTIINAMRETAQVPIDKLRKAQGFEGSVENCYDFPLSLLAQTEEKLGKYVGEFGESHISDILNSSIETAKKYLNERKDMFPQSDLSLINASLHPRNFIPVSPGKIRFVEWDRSRIGDRAFDAYLLMRLNNLNYDQQKEILNANGGPDKNFHMRVVIYHELAKMRNLLTHTRAYTEEIRRGQKPSKDLEKEMSDHFKDIFKRQMIPPPKIKSSVAKKSLEQLVEKKIPFMTRVKTKVKDFYNSWGWRENLKVAGLAASIAAVGFGGYQVKKDADLEWFLASLKSRSLSKAAYMKYPFRKNRTAAIKAITGLKDVRSKLWVNNIGEYLDNNGWRQICYPTQHPREDKTIETCFVGEEAGTHNDGGVKITLLESGEKGILPLDIILGRINAFIGNVPYDNGTNEIVVDMTPVRAFARKLVDNIKSYKANDKLCKAKADACSVTAQSLFESIKGEDVAKNYENVVLRNTVIHEPPHDNDKKNGYDLVDGEVSSYSRQVSSAEDPFVFGQLLEHEKKGNNSPHSIASKKLLTCLRESPIIKKDLDLLGLSRKQRTKLGNDCKRKILKK